MVRITLSLLLRHYRLFNNKVKQPGALLELLAIGFTNGFANNFSISMPIALTKAHVIRPLVNNCLTGGIGKAPDSTPDFPFFHNGRSEGRDEEKYDDVGVRRSR